MSIESKITLAIFAISTIINMLVGLALLARGWGRRENQMDSFEEGFGRLHERLEKIDAALSKFTAEVWDEIASLRERMATIEARCKTVHDQADYRPPVNIESYTQNILGDTREKPPKPHQIG